MLKATEIEAITADLWYVPLERLAEVRALVQRLREEVGYDEPVDDSDEWTDEDRRDYTRASMLRLEQDDPWPEEDGECSSPARS